MRLSKGLDSIPRLLALVLTALFAAGSGVAQPRILVEIDADNLPRVKISGSRMNSRFPQNPRHLSVLSDAGASGSGIGRMSGLELFGADRKPLSYKRLMAGEYLADDDIVSWQYSLDLSPSASPTSAAHRSWIVNEKGLLMLDDLLPAGIATPTEVVAIEVKAPPGWTISSPGSSSLWEGLMLTANYTKDTILIGKSWRQKTLTWREFALDIHVNGNWHFTDEDVSKMAGEIFREYERTFGSTGGTRAGIIIAPFPNAGRPGDWEAETRGNTVVLISTDMPFRTQSLQRLHEQLRHELFHLWIPNGVNLTGNYDWFYEGFALYQSLKLAVGLNRIRFEDFLDTLSRAHTIDSVPSQRISLIQASTNRFGGSNTQVYARGMLVAFLTDLTMLERSKGKRSVEDLLKDLYIKHRRPAAAVDGNASVIELMKTKANAGLVVEKYVTGTDKIEWANELAAAGIEDSDPGLVTTLRVIEKLEGRQKAMLDKLGYNNWRKLSRTSK
jgi:hypothetical protein